MTVYESLINDIHELRRKNEQNYSYEMERLIDSIENSINYLSLQNNIMDNIDSVLEMAINNSF